MGHEGIGSLKDYAANHGLDVRSEEALSGYNEVLTENYRKIRVGEAALNLVQEPIMHSDIVITEEQK